MRKTSEKHVQSRTFNKSTKENPLLYFLYFISFPLASIFIKCKINPHLITTFSNLTAISALVCLYFVSYKWIFPLLWFFALIFDICDGIVARRTNRSSAIGSLYDHASDQIKIILLFGVVAIKYSDRNLSVLCYGTATLFLLAQVWNAILGHRMYLLKTKKKNDMGNKTTNTGKPTSTVVKLIFMGIFSSLFMLQGNSMLWLLPVSFGLEPSIICIFIFLLLVLRSLRGSLKMNIYVAKEMAQHEIAWK